MRSAPMGSPLRLNSCHLLQRQSTANLAYCSIQLPSKAPLACLTAGNITFGQPMNWSVTRRQIRKLVGQKQLRTRFLSIGIYDGKVLSLESHNQTRVDIKIVHDHICMRPTYESGVQHSKIRFRGIQTDKLQGFELKEATWRDGSNAWLDSRGLLHLKSSDKSLPELTIVLTDDPLGGWLSTGQVWGAAFFQPPDGMLRASNQQVMDIITKFTINIISRC